MLSMVLLSLLAFSDNVFLSGFSLERPFDANSVYVINTKTLEMKVFLRDDFFIDSISESPEGDFLAFLAEGDYGRLRILKIVDRNGAVVRRVGGAGASFSWSPDGTRLAYCVAEEPNWEPTGVMRILNVTSGENEEAPCRGYPLYWSSKTKKLLFGSGEGVESLDVMTRAVAKTKLPTLNLSPTEHFCHDDFEEGPPIPWRIYRVTTYEQEPEKLAEISVDLPLPPRWLNSRLLWMHARLEDAGTFYWYALDCASARVYESKDNILAADEEDSLLILKTGKVARKKVAELTQVPLDRLKIMFSLRDQHAPNQPSAKIDK